MKVDMSAKAVTARLKRVSRLRDLALSLGKAKLSQKPEKAKENVKGKKSSPEK